MFSINIYEMITSCGSDLKDWIGSIQQIHLLVVVNK